MAERVEWRHLVAYVVISSHFQACHWRFLLPGIPRVLYQHAAGKWQRF